MRKTIFILFFVSSFAHAQTWPSDYAREPTMQSIQSALTQSGTASSDPVIKTDSEIRSQFFPGTFDGLLGWRLPLHSSICPVSSFSAFGSVFVFDGHCDLFSNHWAGVRDAMMVVWTLSALFIVLKA